MNFYQIFSYNFCISPESVFKTAKSTSDEPTADGTIMRVNGYVQEWREFWKKSPVAWSKYHLV
jgi:hypothetical protein